MNKRQKIRNVGVRKVLAVLLVTMLVLGLAACGGRTTMVTPIRGEWDDHVFTSESLGLRFVLPANWMALSDAEIAQMRGLAAGAMGAAGVEIPEDAAGEIPDMQAVNPLTGSNIQINFYRGGRGRAPSRDQAIELMTEGFDELGGMDIRVIDTPGTTRIGAYDWYSFGTEIEMMGISASGYNFFNIYGGYLRVIIITVMTDFETLEDFLPQFIGLDDPIPEPPAAERAEALVGTWAWDVSEEFTYELNADGTGIRGIPGNTEEFEWHTEGNDHLIMDLGFQVESWTFTITDDVLTIDSRQVPGTTWSYIRVS